MTQQTERDALIERLRKSGPSCNISWDVGDAVKLLTEQAQRIAELEALSVTNIMIDVVPGDGSGFEVYAKSVDDVVDLLTKMGGELEDAQRTLVTLRAELDALRGREVIPKTDLDLRIEQALDKLLPPVAPAHPVKCSLCGSLTDRCHLQNAARADCKRVAQDVNAALPSINDEDLEWVSDNPNTSDIVNFIQGYALRALANAKAQQKATS